MQNNYSPGQLVFGCDMIILIKNEMDWELIRQLNNAQINKDAICKIYIKLIITIK